MREKLHSKIDAVKVLAEGSKLSRLLRHPYKYIHAVLFREFSYKRKRKEKEIITQTFFGREMRLLLPCSTDIYLTGGKSDESEIRLAKLMINVLDPGDSVVDIGAHYGYFTLLAAELVGEQGKVISFEAAPKTYEVLRKNTQDLPQVRSNNLAVSDKDGVMTFYEFPILYSEYNTLKVEQFENEQWFEEQKPEEIQVKTVTLDGLLAKQSTQIKLVKIDVEGAEFQVLKGCEEYLSQQAPMVVMEYLSADRHNASHLEAENFITGLGYSSYVITAEGNLVQIGSVADHMKQRGLDSDNVVFVKG